MLACVEVAVRVFLGITYCDARNIVFRAPARQIRRAWLATERESGFGALIIAPTVIDVVGRK